uniref:mRNA (guanine-N(7))-methyltransferase n=1 Tax=viral metagenome TaxID=1070528 RepID=A0A6C0HLZ2_9ZZZZ
MIRLDKQTNQKETILALISHTLDNPELELECLINNSPNRNKPNITHDNFIAIIKRLKNHPDYIDKSTYKLNISFPATSKYKDVRVTVKSPGAIKSYCNNESLTIIRNNVDFEMKQLAKVQPNRMYMPNYNMRFNLKLERNFNNNEARIKEIIRDWGTEAKQYRFKKTFSFIKKTGDYSIDVSIVKSSIQEDKYLTVKEVNELELYNNIVKPDTVKVQFAMWWNSIKDKPDEKVQVKNYDNSYITIAQSNVFNNIPTYEVEVEYIKNKTTDKIKFKSLVEKKTYIDGEFTNYFKQIGIVLQCVGNSFFIMNNDEKWEVRRNMIKVVENSINESSLAKSSKRNDGGDGDGNANDGGDGDGDGNASDGNRKTRTIQKGGSLSDDSDGDGNADAHGTGNDDVFSETEAAGDGSHFDEKHSKLTASDEVNRRHVLKGGALTKKIADIRRIVKQNMERGVFFGPNIVDLSYSAIARIDPKSIPNIKYNTNININYAVTDKTDGERNLMFIDNDGHSYGVDRANNIKKLGIKLPQLANSIFDGEFINRNEAGKLINHYYIFDCYVYRGDNVMNKPFNCNRQTGRHSHITASAKYFSTGTDIIQDNDKMPLLIFKKEYLLGNSIATFSELEDDETPLIFDQCGKLLNKMNKSYGGFIDTGHLFTYKTDGLVFLPDNLSVFQTFEGEYIENTFKQESWGLNYKWKPADHLTVDFKVQYQKDLDSKGVKYAYFNEQKFVQVNLISKVYPNSRFKNQLNFWLLNCGLNLKNIPEDFIFFAQNPCIATFDADGNIDNQMGVAYLPVDTNDNVICNNNDIIVDGIIAEFSYNISRPEPQFRWTAERIRADKTAPNAYFGTAVGAWQLINNPITKEYLSSGRTGGTGGKSGDTKESPIGLSNVVYYTEEPRGAQKQQYATAPLNKFNNFVKSFVIERALSGYIKPKVLDLACGRFAEMFKWVENSVDFCLGIDINADNIYNQYDGGATRIMEKRAIMPAIGKLAERTILLVGNTTKNIASGEVVGGDPLNRYFLDVLYGRAKGRTPKLKRLESIALDGFDMVSCMYAIHYMLDSEEMLDNFLRNVSENLMDQAYFIGTCLDGPTVLKTLGSQDELIGTIGDKVVYSIKKQGEYKKLTIGNKVTTFYETFAGHFDENLVNMAYLRERALTHNLKLIEYKSFIEEPISLLTQYEKEKSQFAKYIRGNDSLITWAKMNYYFMFQKVRDINE